MMCWRQLRRRRRGYTCRSNWGRGDMWVEVSVLRAAVWWFATTSWRCPEIALRRGRGTGRARGCGLKLCAFCDSLCEWRGVRAKGPVVAEREVGDRAAEDGNPVGDKHRPLCGLDEETHEGEVSEQRDQAVGEMEAEQLRGKGGVVAAVAPGVVNVPDEVVQHGE